MYILQLKKSSLNFKIDVNKAYNLLIKLRNIPLPVHLIWTKFLEADNFRHWNSSKNYS